MTDAAIRLDEVSKRFWLAQERRTGLKERFVRGRGSKGKEFFALKDASFEVPRGTTFGLVGHNGSGKSTALKVIAGIYRPTSGDVMVDGRLSALLELGAGFHGELTGRENIRLNGAILGMSRSQVDAAMDGIIDFSGIGDFIDTPVKVYSSGMFVRLGFAIAVTVEPEILAIDEVIAVGDEEFQRKCFDRLYELRRRGTTIVLVSHDLGLMEEICDNVVWLDHGEVQAVGASRDVVRGYLDRVNRREGQASHVDPTAVSAPDGSGEVRTGSGDVRVSRVQVLDGEGAESVVLLSDDPATVRLHYEALYDVPEATFGVTFVHESGVGVAGPNSSGQGPWHIEQGVGFVDFHVDSLVLNPGTFTLSVAVANRGHFFDQAERQATIKVRGHGADEPGLVRMRGEWTHVSGPMANHDEGERHGDGG
ncbi:MAG TPA: ABC transporter ATP-binding protein [Candidatus Nanopelagicales bacterium]